MTMMRKFLKGSASAAAAGALSRGIGLLTLPVLVRFLDKSEYGAYDYFLTIGMLLAVLVTVEIGQSITRFAGRDAEPVYRDTVTSTVLFFMVFGLVTFAACAIYWASELAIFLFDDVNMAASILPFSLFLSATVLNNYVSRVLRADHRFGWAAIYVFSTSLVSAVLVLAGVVFLEFGLPQILYVSAAASFSVFFVFFAVFIKPFMVLPDFSLLRKLLNFSAPLVFSSAAIVVSLFSDRFLIAELLGMESVAIYAVAARLAFVVSVVTTAFQVTVNPLVYSAAGDRDALQPLSKIFLIYFVLTAGIFISFDLFSDPVVLLIAGPDYADAAAIISVLSLAVMMQSAYIFFPGLLVASRTRAFAVINVLAALMNICLNIVLIQSAGVFGAALATLISSVSAFALVGLYSLYDVKFPGKSLLFWLYVVFGVAVIALNWPGEVQFSLLLGSVVDV